MGRSLRVRVGWLPSVGQGSRYLLDVAGVTDSVATQGAQLSSTPDGVGVGDQVSASLALSGGGFGGSFGASFGS